MLFPFVVLFCHNLVKLPSISALVSSVSFSIIVILPYCIPVIISVTVVPAIDTPYIQPAMPLLERICIRTARLMHKLA